MRRILAKIYRDFLVDRFSIFETVQKQPPSKMMLIDFGDHRFQIFEKVSVKFYDSFLSL